MIARSFLFVPGDRPERFSKALATAAHRIVIDLEDAVSIDAKAAARVHVADFLSRQPSGQGLSPADRMRIVIRVNAYGTPWHDDDVRMVRDVCGAGAMTSIAALMIPKTEHAEPMADIARRAPADIGLIALVESVAGVVHLHEVAQSSHVAQLAFGSFDYGVDAGVEGSGRELDAVRSAFVIASRYADKPAPIDGVTLSIDDATAIDDDVRLGRQFGFGAKLCIHPRQVEAVHRGFAPTPAERAWADRVMTALKDNPKGAIAVDGKLVDKPIIDRAKRILAG